VFRFFGRVGYQLRAGHEAVEFRVQLGMTPVMVLHAGLCEKTAGRDVAGDAASRLLMPADIERDQLRKELQLAVR
jgi:hypothetical protein